MKVEIWSDIVCPFCYIGKRKFEKALESFDGKEGVEIEWKSFQLDPSLQYVAGQSVHEYLGRRKGRTAAEGKQMNDAMAGMAREVGLEYNFDQAIINNTMDAHRLLHLAKKRGLQDAMKERLFAAYYTEGKNIGHQETLLQLGESIGLDPVEIRNILKSDTFREEVLQDQEEAEQIGVNGVPFFVFNHKYAVSGAQPTDVFRQVLDKVRLEERPLTVENETGFCTTDGTCS